MVALAAAIILAARSPSAVAQQLTSTTQPRSGAVNEYGAATKAILDRLQPVADRKALVVELPRDVALGVNMVYPFGLPLATFPGRLLEALPELPKGLEYRIVGRHLILRDVTGNIIVDILRDVFPIPR